MIFSISSLNAKSSLNAVAVPEATAWQNASSSDSPNSRPATIPATVLSPDPTVFTTSPLGFWALILLVSSTYMAPSPPKEIMTD